MKEYYVSVSSLIKVETKNATLLCFIRNSHIKQHINCSFRLEQWYNECFIWNPLRSVSVFVYNQFGNNISGLATGEEYITDSYIRYLY